MSWAEIQGTLNSTMGTSEFKPLNEILLNSLGVKNITTISQVITIADEASGTIAFGQTFGNKTVLVIFSNIYNERAVFVAPPITFDGTPPDFGNLELTEVNNDSLVLSNVGYSTLTRRFTISAIEFN